MILKCLSSLTILSDDFLNSRAYRLSFNHFISTGQEQEDEESPFLPPITPKNKPKAKPKSFVVSREIATQITADALIPPQPMGDFWVNKDTVLNRSDPYADVALRVSTICFLSSFQLL